MHNKKLLFLIEIPIFVAFAIILDIVPFLNFKIWAQGGSISLAMIPIFMIAFRYGFKGGLTAGLLFGILQIAVGNAYILVPLQGILDYGVAFTALGFAGVVAKQIQKNIRLKNNKKALVYIILGVFIGIVLRFIAHFFAGAVFFGTAVDGMSKWIYSFLYNASYMGPSFLICVLAIYYLFKKQPQLLLFKA